MQNRRCGSDNIEYTNSRLKSSHRIPAGGDDLQLTKLAFSIQYENDGARQLYLLITDIYKKCLWPILNYIKRQLF